MEKGQFHQDTSSVPANISEDLLVDEKFLEIGDNNNNQFYSVFIEEFRDAKESPTEKEPLDNILHANQISPIKTQAEDSAAISANKFVISKISTDELHTCFQCRIKRKVRYSLKKADVCQYICYDNCLNNFKTENDYILNWFPLIQVRNFTNPDQPKLSRHCAVCRKIIADECSLTWQAMDFCNELCLHERQIELGSVCLQCTTPVAVDKHCISFGSDIRQFCSDSCLQDQKRTFEMCDYCLQDLLRTSFQIFMNVRGVSKKFCCQQCADNYAEIPNPPQVEEGTKCDNCQNQSPIIIKYESFGFDVPKYFCDDECFEIYCCLNFINASRCCYCQRYVSVDIQKKHTVFHDFALRGFCSLSCRKLYVVENKTMVHCCSCSVKKYDFDMISKYLDGRVFACGLECLFQFKNYLERSVCSYCRGSKELMFNLSMGDGVTAAFCSLLCLNKFNSGEKSAIAPKVQAGDGRETSTSNQELERYIVTKPKPTQNQAGASSLLKIKQQDKSIVMKKNRKYPKGGQTEKYQREKQYVAVPIQQVPVTLPAFSSAFCAIYPKTVVTEDIKYSLGLNAWTHWMRWKSSRKTDILKLTTHKLTSSLAQFVKELRKTDGTEYTPDTIYYLCLGIQKYLQENGRHGNIFYDPQYREFRESFDKIAQKSVAPNNPYFVTKVEENHLWETKQLGCHCPQALLMTVLFVITKHFNLKSVEDHLQLSLKQFAKQFLAFDDRSSEIVTIKLYRFTGSEETFVLRKNWQNPDRCPIRLCRLYLTKCPTNMRLCDEVFYLEPEKHYVQDGPFWFSAVALSPEAIQQNVNLINMVKGINEA